MTKKTYWRKKLAEPVELSGDRALETLADAGNFITGLPADRWQRDIWLYAMELLLAAAKSGKEADILEATMQMRRAVMADGYRPARKRAGG